MRFLIVKLFAFVSLFLLALSCIRVTFGISEPLTFTGMLRAFEAIDFSFSHTYGTIIDVVNAFSSISVGGWDAVLDVLKAIVQIITLPINIVQDLFVTLAGCFVFITRLLGFTP